jgi:predicted pyridoxine 5'-phosphate oxidase superfamily flavin-nucleotide-binding protein
VLQISTQIAAEDPLASAIDVGAALGLLGIELSTRRRNRAAGVVETVDGPGRFTIRVRQSFGNCPQYIQARKPLQPTGWRVPGVARRSTSFAGWRALLQGADTFFIATRSALLDGAPAHGVDVSHRGGLPGFIEILDDGRFLFPDYRGNFFFNTFGNLLLDRRAGLLFPDFGGHGLLHMTGNAQVVWAQPDQQRFPGALRLVSVEVDEVLWRPHALPLDFEFAGYSPHLARLQAMPLSRPA